MDEIKKGLVSKRGNENGLSSPYRLGYHIIPHKGWLNDPNGLIQIENEYHVFFQHNPFSAKWGLMHWGHFKSNDLVHWEQLPIALTPGDCNDVAGCFSGSAVEDDGVLNLIYTGHNYADAEKKIPNEVQCRAFSIDGTHFKKDLQNPVIQEHPESGSGDFRDPKVWKHGQFWYLVVGTTKDGIGKVVLYRSTDLQNWAYQGVLAQSDGSQGYMWECPDFYKLDGKYVLMFSPQGIKPSGDHYQNLYQTGYLIGDYDYSTNIFNHGPFTELDHGHDFYAVQSFEDNKGRRIAIGWMDMWMSPMPEAKEGWAGALTLPREINLVKGKKIRMTPVKEVELLRIRQLLSCREEQIIGEKTFSFKEDLLEIEVEFDEISASDFGISLRVGQTEKSVIHYDTKFQKLILDLTKSGQAARGIRQVSLPLEGSLKFHIFLDRSSIEVFVNDGDVVLTSRIYPTEKNQGMQIFTNNGNVKIRNFIIWELEDIWKNMNSNS
ncbi:glycoside hydrolase family 32 protein [Sporolactobacillus vineae]|uniref:glycoside hydrolase family 32 protein n=1 Tax=Sporolactobacillus vineae TaxID=444463 RepID=UPI000288FAA4|nr:glycoside hydrolase family 32 protein [Sporolactobacillus vineae]